MGVEKTKLSILEFQKESRTWTLYLAAFILFIHNTILGMSLFIASVALPYHKEASFGYVKLSEEEETTYCSLHMLFMLIGSFVGSPLGDWMGRKKIFLISNVLTMVGTSMGEFSTSFYPLLVARCICGFSVGIGILMPIVYASEISIIRMRSNLSNSCNLAINCGGLAIYLINMVIPAEYIAYPIISLNVLFLVTSFFLPGSPHWTIRKGNIAEARKIYSYLRGPEYEGLEAEIKEATDVINSDESEDTSRWTSRSFLHPMGILAFLFSVIGLSGIDAPITVYGAKMFAEFGFHIPYQYIMLMIPIGSFVGYVVAVPMLEWMKKKTQYNLCALLMALSSALVGAAYFLKDSHTDFEHSSISYVSQIFLATGAAGITFGYGAGIGAVTYTLPGELLVPKDKAIGCAIAEFFRLIWSTGMLKVYPFCVSLVGYPSMFAFHTTVMLLAVWFVYRYLPETKDKSLSELQSIFQKKQIDAV